MFVKSHLFHAQVVEMLSPKLYALNLVKKAQKWHQTMLETPSLIEVNKSALDL